MTKSIRFAALACGAILAMTVSAGSAQDSKLIAADEYRNSCQACHGERGTGDGPFAKYLNVKPADLTQLAKKNDGNYPFLKVFQIIDGRSIVAGHGDKAMPIWGQRYTADAGDKYGPYGGETAVRARVLELVYYVQSLQQK